MSRNGHSFPPRSHFKRRGDSPSRAVSTRRRRLQILADGQGRTATVLAGNVGKRLDATLKHLVALRGAGLFVTAENPQDGRRQLYHLAPAIPATKTERGWEMDFGYCLVRGAPINK